MKWRARTVRRLHTKSLHLLDSAVSLGVISKRRSSSVRLHRVIRRLNAVELASLSQTVYAFVRSELNPADAPSRSWKRRGDPLERGDAAKKGRRGA